MAVAVLLAAGGAFLAALAVVFQRVALESAPAEHNLSHRLITHALKSRGWLIGLVIMLAQFGLQASALRFGQLSVVQPIMTTELIFLVAILVFGFRRTVGWRELAGIAAIVAGLAGFFVAASPAAGKGQPDNSAWLVMSAVVAGGAAILILTGRTGPRWWRATALGAAAAVLFAYNAALTKTMTTLLREGGWTHVFTSWVPYLIAVSGALGLFILASALHAGPIAASRTANVIVNPLVSIVIGISAFSERMRSGTGFVLLDMLAIAVMCGGVVVLVRSPLVGGISGQASDEFLSRTSGHEPASPPALLDQPDASLGRA